MATVAGSRAASPMSAAAIEMMRQDSSAVLKEQLEGDGSEAAGHNVSSR